MKCKWKVWNRTRLSDDADLYTCSPHLASVVTTPTNRPHGGGVEIFTKKFSNHEDVINLTLSLNQYEYQFVWGLGQSLLKLLWVTHWCESIWSNERVIREHQGRLSIMFSIKPTKMGQKWQFKHHSDKQHAELYQSRNNLKKRQFCGKHWHSRVLTSLCQVSYMNLRLTAGVGGKGSTLSVT